MKKTILLLFTGCIISGTTLKSQTAGLNLDGTNDYVNTPVTLTPATFTAITFECWVKSPNAPSVVNGYSGPMYGDFFAITWNHANIFHRGAASLGVASGTTTQFVSVQFGTLASDTWYHLAGTWDGTTLIAYKNGVPVNFTSASGVIASSSLTLKLGKHPTIANFFEGDIDAVRIWNKALSCDEISISMNSNTIAPQAGLIASYNFDNGIANGTNTAISTVPDMSGGSNTATLSGLALTGTLSNFADPAPFNNTVPPTPSSLSVSPSATAICKGDTITLTASGALLYNWEPQSIQANTISISPTVATTYTLFGSNGGCYATKVITVAVIDCSTPPPPPVTTGLSATTNKNLFLFPNPAQEQLTLNFPGIRNGASIRLVDLTGKVLKEIYAQQESVTVDISELEPGIYMVTVYAENKYYSHRMIKN